MLSNGSDFFDVTLVWSDYKDGGANKIKTSKQGWGDEGHLYWFSFWCGNIGKTTIKEGFTPAKPQSFMNFSWRMTSLDHCSCIDLVSSTRAQDGWQEVRGGGFKSGATTAAARFLEMFSNWRRRWTTRWTRTKGGGGHGIGDWQVFCENVRPSSVIGKEECQLTHFQENCVKEPQNPICKLLKISF